MVKIIMRGKETQNIFDTGRFGVTLIPNTRTILIILSTLGSKKTPYFKIDVLSRQSKGISKCS